MKSVDMNRGQGEQSNKNMGELFRKQGSVTSSTSVSPVVTEGVRVSDTRPGIEGVGWMSKHPLDQRGLRNW